jgi:hypothetical protein
MPLAFDRVALSMQRALVGEIDPTFRAICLSVTDAAVTVTIFHHGALSPGIADAMDSAMAEVYADFPELSEDRFPILLGFDRRDAPQPLPAIGVPIFAVKGTQFLVHDDDRPSRSAPT